MNNRLKTWSACVALIGLLGWCPVLFAANSECLSGAGDTTLLATPIQTQGISRDLSWGIPTVTMAGCALLALMAMAMASTGPTAQATVAGEAADCDKEGAAPVNTTAAGPLNGMDLMPDSSLLEVLLENSPDFIYFKDRESRFVRVSKAMAEHFRQTDPAQVVGKTDFDFFVQDRAQLAYNDEQEIIRTGKAIVGKLEMEVHIDGRVKWVKTAKMPWRDQNGNIIGTFGISTNVTELKDAQEKLATERELLRTLLDNVPERIYFKDRESRFVHVSSSKVRKTLERVPQLKARYNQLVSGQEGKNKMASAGADLMVGLTDFDLCKEEHARPAYEDEQEIIRTGKPIIGKLEKETHFDGSVTWSLTSKLPWFDRDGNIIGTFGLSRDID